MSAIAVIPARYDSQRLPGKALAEIAGRTMIEHVYRRASESAVDAVWVATDDPRIVDAVKAFGGRVELTSDTHRSGSDRVWELASRHPADIVVNVQGDEPLVDPETINAVLAALDDPGVQMATASAPLEGDPGDPNVVKVVTALNGDALYFSRSPIPHGARARQHLGLYAFRREALAEFVALSPGTLERTERLEQLRWLEHGRRLRVVPVPAASPSVDTPADLEAVRELFARNPARSSS